MNKKNRIGIAILLLLVFGLTAFAPQTQAAVIIAQPGDNNEAVGEINLMLKTLGYYYGAVSNSYGTSTKAAVTLFQRANSLEATGTVDSVTYDLLKVKYTGGGQAVTPAPTPIPTPTPVPAPSPVPASDSDVIAKPGDVNDKVGQINLMLKTLGYYFASPSNYYTTSTKYAVVRFQSTNGLNATGIVDSKTFNLLQSKYQALTPATTPTPVPAPTPAPAPAPIAGLTVDEQLMFNMVNQERAKAGLKPLQIDMRMVKSARLKSQDLITNDYFAHTSPVYGSFATLIRTYAPDYSYVGENLAGNKTVELAMIAFMNSAGHKKNILSPNYTHIGIGIVSGGPYGKMFTQHFGG